MTIKRVTDHSSEPSEASRVETWNSGDSFSGAVGGEGFAQFNSGPSSSRTPMPQNFQQWPHPTTLVSLNHPFKP